jgi:hypothetical protein
MKKFEVQTMSFPIDSADLNPIEGVWNAMKDHIQAHFPMKQIGYRAYRRFGSPLQRMAGKLASILLDRLKVVEAYAIAPWQSRMPVITDEAGWLDGRADPRPVIKVAISSLVKDGMMGAGRAVRDRLTHGINSTPATYAVAVGPRTEPNPYTAELIAMSRILRQLTIKSTNRRIIL